MLLLEKVFSILNDSGLDYCVQNKYETMPEAIPSDIDMMYRGAGEKELDSVVQKIAHETSLLITQKIVQDYCEYTYILSPAAPKDKFQLQLDFYRVISHGKHRNVLLDKDLLDRKRFYKIFYVPDPLDEIIYIIVRRTLKKDFSNEHLDNIICLQNNLKEDSASDAIRTIFGSEVAACIEKMISQKSTDVFYEQYPVFRNAIERIQKKNYGVFDAVKYLAFKLWNYPRNRILHKCGMSVAFLAPDGAGKSTIINAINKTCSGSFYGIENIYFRPHLFKNLGHYNKINPSEEATTNTNPHNVTLDGKAKSFIRFLFYNADFLLGTMFKINKYKMKKQLVVFDRYYYDYYADMKRYKYSLSSEFAEKCAWMIPAPDLIFVLDAPEKVIYERKQELSLEEIRHQREKFGSLLKTKLNVAVIDVNRSVEDIVDDVTSRILIYQSEKTKKILKKNSL